MPLITTQAELNANITTSATNDIDVLQPYISDCEVKYIKPILGEVLFDELTNQYEANPQTLTTENTKLLALVHKALANFTYYAYIPFANVTISDSGLSSNRENAPFKWQQDQIEESILDISHRAVDEILKYLETNKATYTSWANSDSFTILKEFFIQNAETYSKYVEIDKSPRTFLQLRSHMRYVEEFTLKPLLTETLYNTIKTEYKASNLSAANILLIPFLEPVLAHLSIARAVTMMNVRLKPSGAVEHSIKAVASGNKQEQKASSDMLEAFQLESENTGSAYLNKLIKFLNENASDYPGFENSDSYSTTTPTLSGGKNEQSTTSGLFNLL